MGPIETFHGWGGEDDDLQPRADVPEARLDRPSEGPSSEESGQEGSGDEESWIWTEEWLPGLWGEEWPPAPPPKGGDVAEEPGRLHRTLPIARREVAGWVVGAALVLLALGAGWLLLTRHPGPKAPPDAALSPSPRLQVTPAPARRTTRAPTPRPSRTGHRRHAKHKGRAERRASTRGAFPLVASSAPLANPVPQPSPPPVVPPHTPSPHPSSKRPPSPTSTPAPSISTSQPAPSPSVSLG